MSSQPPPAPPPSGGGGPLPPPATTAPSAPPASPPPVAVAVPTPPPPAPPPTEPSSLNSGYGSGDETTSLLAPAPGGGGGGSAPHSKPVLTRQDCASSFPLSEDGARSVPDLEMHCRLDTGCPARGTRSAAPLPPTSQHVAPGHARCRCEMLAPAPLRSASRESVRQPPSVLLSSSPCHGTTRVVRQSSQPEPAAPCSGHCGHHSAGSASLRQLREPADGIAGIAADSLRINGAIRQFKQGVLLCPQTLAQARRARLRRAFTDATNDSVAIARTVFDVQDNCEWTSRLTMRTAHSTTPQHPSRPPVADHTPSRRRDLVASTTLSHRRQNVF